MKWIKWIVLAILVLLVGGALVTYAYLDHIVKVTVEKQATASLNLQTDVGSASLALFGGKLNLADLQIASPPGFTSPKMLTLGSADVSVSYGQLDKDPVHISTVVLTKPRLVVEQSAGAMNFKKASDQIPQAPPSNKPPMKLVVDDLQVKDATVVFLPGIPGLPDEITVPVPDLAMKNVGTGPGNENGAALKDVAMQVIAALVAKAGDSNAIPPELRPLLSGDLSQVTSRLGAEAQKQIAAAVPGDLGKALGNLAADPNALIKDPAGAATRSLSNLIPGTQPSDIGKAADALGGLLNQPKKDKDKKDK
jgi:hypothetical protein